MIPAPKNRSTRGFRSGIDADILTTLPSTLCKSLDQYLTNWKAWNTAVEDSRSRLETYMVHMFKSAVSKEKSWAAIAFSRVALYAAMMTDLIRVS